MDTLKLIEENNMKRDTNLHNKLDSLKSEILKVIREERQDIFEKVDVSINKRIEHLKSSPDTINKFNKVDILCAQRGEQIIAMKDDIGEIKAMVKDISCKLDNELATKIDKDTFEFWRNILISGVIISIFVGVITMLLEHFLKQ